MEKYTIDYSRAEEQKLRTPLIKKLSKYVCINCGYFKSQHRIGCPESGRLRSFKPGGYPDLPQEVWALILNLEVK